MFSTPHGVLVLQNLAIEKLPSSRFVPVKSAPVKSADLALNLRRLAPDKFAPLKLAKGFPNIDVCLLGL